MHPLGLCPIFKSVFRQDNVLHLKLDVLYKLVELVDYTAVSSLLFRVQEHTVVEVYSASGRGAVKSEHFVTGTCN